MKLELLEQAIQSLKIAEPVRIDLKLRLKRAAEEQDVLDAVLLLDDLRHEVKRLANQVVTFTDLYDKPRERTGKSERVGKASR